jgi:hypothetical protein
MCSYPCRHHMVYMGPTAPRFKQAQWYLFVLSKPTEKLDSLRLSTGDAVLRVLVASSTLLTCAACYNRKSISTKHAYAWFVRCILPQHAASHMHGEQCGVVIRLLLQLSVRTVAICARMPSCIHCA